MIQFSVSTTSKVELKPCCPVTSVLNETHLFKKVIGRIVALLYEAVNRVAFSVEFLGHVADQNFGVAFPSVFWQGMQNAQGAVIVHKYPGHRLTLHVCDATGWEVADKLFNIPVSLLIPSELPSFIDQVGVGDTERRNP